MSTPDQHTDLPRHVEPGHVDPHHPDGHNREYPDPRFPDQPHPEQVHPDTARHDLSRVSPAHEDMAHEDMAHEGTLPTEPRHDGAGPTRTSEVGRGTGAPTGSSTDADGRERLVSAERVDSYGSRWDAVKGTFVDEPRRAVAEADALVGELLDELEQLFRKQRSDIEHGLDADETSTEDMRLALRRYRSFFDRLLTL